MNYDTTKPGDPLTPGGPIFPQALMAFILWSKGNPERVAESAVFRDSGFEWLLGRGTGDPHELVLEYARGLPGEARTTSRLIDDQLSRRLRTRCPSYEVIRTGHANSR